MNFYKDCPFYIWNKTNNIMSMPINRECYEMMINEDIKWLDEICPEHGLYYNHIVAVLKESIEHIYGRGYKIR